MGERGLTGEGMGWWKKGGNEEEEGVQRLKRKLRGLVWKQRQAVARARAQVRPDGPLVAIRSITLFSRKSLKFHNLIISRPSVVSPHRILSIRLS